MTAAVSPRAALPLFALAIFISAALVFALEPMVARMILPLLGGSPAVWNTAMLFFQAALLAGYGYAHLLQRFAPVRAQVAIHLVLLAAATLFLPIGMSHAGAPPTGSPVWWLLGTLAAMAGAPFVILSATTPLLQAWYATRGRNPYPLYAASNLGSMLALLAYPVVAEPLLGLTQQARDWSYVYALFVVIVATAGVVAWRAGGGAALRNAVTENITALRRLRWVLLAAGPSSLMLGATSFIANDVVSAPLFWVVPLALYLLTFVIAFQSRPAMGAPAALRWQALFAVLAAGLLCIASAGLVLHALVYLGALFFGALVCHGALAADRPQANRLTEFYLLISLGGVIGGAFNALAAPLIFSNVHEFPIMLALVCLARPWGHGPLRKFQTIALLIGVAAAVTMLLLPPMEETVRQGVVFALVVTGCGAALLLSSRAPLLALLIAAFALQWAQASGGDLKTLRIARSFFGVSRLTVEPLLWGGDIHVLYHGTTIHGAQAQAPALRCHPTTYYTASGPLGKTLTALQASSPALNIAIVGLGAGTMAAYTRPADRLRYFEIDPEVARIARDPSAFTFLSDCARGKVDIVLGDARLTFAAEQQSAYDMIILDAFSADAIPTHLLTREALALYLRALKPDGVIALHLSNRNLSLEAPAAATARAAGAIALFQTYIPATGITGLQDEASQVMLLARSQDALARFARGKGWRQANARDVKAWTDDYSNVTGAMLDHLRKR